MSPPAPDTAPALAAARHATPYLAAASILLGIASILMSMTRLGAAVAGASLLLGLVVVLIRIGVGRKGLAVPGTYAAIVGLLLAGMGLSLAISGVSRDFVREKQALTQTRGMYIATITYAHGSNNRWSDLADDIGLLFHRKYFTADYPISPFTSLQTPTDFDDWSAEAQVLWVRQNASVVLVPGRQLRREEIGKITAFLRPEHAGGRGTIVALLTFDETGNVFRIDELAEVERLLLEQTGQTMQQLIDRQVNLTTPVR